MLKENGMSPSRSITADNLDIRTHHKFVEMREVFERLFQIKGYVLNSYIEKDVWFLEQDIAFHSSIRPSATTPLGTEANMMHKLMRELSINGEDFKKLKIETEKFIDRICEILFEAQIMVVKTRALINEYKAHENLNILNEKCKLLNQKYESKVTSSTLDVRIVAMDRFPIGDYRFDFHFIEVNPRDVSVSSSVNKSLKDQGVIKISQEKEIVVFNIGSTDNSFETVTLTAIGDNNPERRRENSGTSLVNFNLRVYLNDKVFAESLPDSFIDYFFNSIDALRDIDKDVISIPAKIKVKTNPEIRKSYNLQSEYTIKTDLRFTLDPITRASILSRICTELAEVTAQESSNEMVKKNLLQTYFPNISKQVNYILEKSDEEEDNMDHICHCKGGCLIF